MLLSLAFWATHKDCHSTVQLQIPLDIWELYVWVVSPQKHFFFQGSIFLPVSQTKLSLFWMGVVLMSKLWRDSTYKKVAFWAAQCLSVNYIWELYVRVLGIICLLFLRVYFVLDHCKYIECLSVHWLISHMLVRSKIYCDSFFVVWNCSAVLLLDNWKQP
jgi:hypothetical protein